MTSKTSSSPSLVIPQPPPQPKFGLPERSQGPTLESASGSPSSSIAITGNRGSLPAPLPIHEIQEPEGTYRGQINHEKRKNGEGAFLYKSGDVYIGVWENGTQNGKGKYTWKSGAAFKGVFYNGSAITRGTMRFANETQITQWFREGIAVQLIDLMDTNQPNGSASEDSVTGFRMHLASWKTLQATLGSVNQPIWSVQHLVSSINSLAETDSLPLFVVSAPASTIRKRGLVLTFADTEAATFLPLSDVLNKTIVLEKAIEYFCKTKTTGGITLDHLKTLMVSSLSCKSLEIGTIASAITDLREALQRTEVSQSARIALSAAAGQAVGLFKRPTSSISPAVSLAISECESIAMEVVSGKKASDTITNIPEEISQLPALYKERRSFETSIPHITTSFNAAKKMLEASQKQANEASAWCAQAILDIYIMATADAITQRIARVALSRDLVTTFRVANGGKVNSAIWCNDLVTIALTDLEEVSAAAKILPPLRNQKEPWDFWEIEQLLGEMNEIRKTLLSKLPSPNQTPPPIPPRTVERKPLARQDPRNLTPIGPQKPYCILKNGLIPLNKDLVTIINKGEVSLLAELFNSCDNIIHTFAAKLLATIVLPWERQSEAVSSERKNELVFSENHCEELLGLLVWHSVNGTLNNTLRRDALHLLNRIVKASDKMKELIVKPRQPYPWLKTMVSLLQGSIPVRTLALQIICNIANQEKYRKDVYTQIGVIPIHKVIIETTPESTDSEILAAQAIGYLLSEQNCLRETQEIGALSRVVDIAREGRIMLHCQISEDDLEIGQEIGRGAYASVHKAKWKGKEVAVKVFNESSMQFRLEDFLLEVAILSIVHHPNLMHMHGAVVKQSKDSVSSFMLVTELLGSSIQRLLVQNKAGFPPAIIHKYATDIASALAYLHSLNLIHRDLKSANLLVDKSSNVKVCDLGLSRMVTNLSMTTCAGTPKWEAPECLESGNYTQMADVYSFGIVLWEMCTAQEPFTDIKTIFELKKAICDKKRRPDIPSNCSPWLRELMKNCWHSHPKKRLTFDQILERLSSCKGSL